jgi:hypothetical protein
MNTSPTDEQIKLAVLYYTYTVIYSGDLSCNLVKDYKRYVNENDKEELKLYKALRKRAVNYLCMLNKHFKDSIEFIAEYNGIMDIVNDNDVEKFTKSIANVYERNGVDGNLAKLETIRVLIEATTENTRASWLTLKSDKLWICYEQMKDMGKVAQSLWNWKFRKVTIKADKPLDVYTKKSVVKRWDKIVDNIFNRDTFERVCLRLIKERENDR